jgi:hypothetical protein
MGILPYRKADEADVNVELRARPFVTVIIATAITLASAEAAAVVARGDCRISAEAVEFGQRRFGDLARLGTPTRSGLSTRFQIATEHEG